MASLYGDVDTSEDVLATLPNGESFILARPYTVGESRGVLVRGIMCFSLNVRAVMLRLLTRPASSLSD